MVIIWAIKNYTLLTQHWTIEMQTFFAWLVVAEPQLIKSEPEDVMTEIANIRAVMRSCILDDPYDRETLKNIYTALRLQFYVRGLYCDIPPRMYQTPLDI